LYNGQAHTGAGELVLGMEPLEGGEQAVRISHVKAHTVVLDLVDPVATDVQSFPLPLDSERR